ncbi:MAG: hypothetical protein HS111_36180 [Kofleriaceae bacterium]|nr:hypothetical protein [Kofleriaceae bacterium]
MDEPLVDLETDKVTVQPRRPWPALAAQAVAVGATVKVGQVGQVTAGAAGRPARRRPSSHWPRRRAAPAAAAPAVAARRPPRHGLDRDALA